MIGGGGGNFGTGGEVTVIVDNFGDVKDTGVVRPALLPIDRWGGSLKKETGAGATSSPKDDGDDDDDEDDLCPGV